METIAGVKVETIRKAYFENQIVDLIDKMNAKNPISEEDAQHLDAFLAGLQNERIEKVKAFRKYTIQEESKLLPTVTELMNLDPDKKDTLDKWELDKKEDYKKARGEVERANQMIKDRNNNREDWLDLGLKLATYQYSIDQYRVWLDQKYRAKLTGIIDDFGCSRAEAEERAKLTSEYRDYKNAVLFREMTEEIIMLCKKYSGIIP